MSSNSVHHRSYHEGGQSFAIHQNGESFTLEGEGQPHGSSAFSSLFHKVCVCTASLIRLLPILIVSAVMIWSYFVFIVDVIGSGNSSFSSVTFFLLLLYHWLLLMFVWTYVKTIVTCPGRVPAHRWKLSVEMSLRLKAAESEEEWKQWLEHIVREEQLSVHQRSVQGAVRYCETCHVIKPDRAHHCSHCGTCILKMDHHCPWVNNCVGFQNYKFYLLFLFYAYVYCILLTLTTVGSVSPWFSSLMSFSTSDENDTASRSEHSAIEPVSRQVLLLFCVATIVLMYLSSLFWYHIFLLVCNRSTLEELRPPRVFSKVNKYAWNIGRRGNIEQVLGSNKLLWLFPVKSTLGNGLHFPTKAARSGRRESEEKYCLATVANNDSLETHFIGRRENDQLVQGDIV